MFPFSSLLFLLSLVLARQDEIPPTSVARVNGQLVQREAYHDWLIRTRAPVLLDEYLQQVLVEQECARRGLGLGPDERREALDRHWRRLVLDTYAGSEERALEELAQAGSSKQQRLDLDRARAEFEALASKLVRARRTPTEEELRALHRRRFGEEARRVELQLAFFRRYPDLRDGERLDADQAQESSRTARARASAFARRLEEATPQEAAVLVRDQSDVLRLSLHLGVFEDLRASGGRLAFYRPELFQGQLEPAVGDAEVGDRVGPLETPDGFYVARILRREDAPFEAVRGELERWFLDAPVTPKELYLLRTELSRTAAIERGRALLEGDGAPR